MAVDRDSSPVMSPSPAQPAAAHPTDVGPRIDLIDVLRGLALLGMILVHFHQQSCEDVDELLRIAIWWFVEGKSHGTFALLFGAGFALLLQRANARAVPFVRVYLRRMLALAAFGFVAHAVFGFNVLLGYAAWGVPLLLIRNWSTRWLFAVALFGAVAAPLWYLAEELVLGANGAEAAFQASRAAAAEVRAAVNAAEAQADWTQLLAARLQHMAWFYRQPFFVVPGPTLTLFVAGMLAVRHRLFEQPLAHKRAIVAAIAFGAVSWLAAWLELGWTFGLLRDQWLTFSYVGVALLLAGRFPGLVRWLRPVGQAGRMALTNYLLQIAVLDLLFSGYALGLTPIRPLVGPLATAALFGTEVIVSCAWLTRFPFGPAEWAWRSLTYWRLQPLRR